MSTLELRSRLHELIDATKSDELLQRLYELLHGWASDKESAVWATLTEADRNRVLKAYATAMDPRKLSATEDVLKRRKA